MQPEGFISTGFPRFSGMSVGTGGGVSQKIEEASGLFNQLVTLINKNSASPIDAQYAYTGLTLAWGGVSNALTAKPVSNG